MSGPTRAPVSGPAADRSSRSEVLVATVITGVATAVVALRDPNSPGHYPGCPFLAMTGLYCPLCGGLRAVHDLTHLDPLGALSRNPLVTLMAPVALFAWVRWVRRSFTGRGARLVPPSWWGWALAALVAVFWVARNLPGMSWLSPA